MSEKASYFNEREHQICLVARMIEDARTYWVAGGGSPMASILLGKKLYAPNAVYVTEDGVIAPEPALPMDPIMKLGSMTASTTALAFMKALPILIASVVRLFFSSALRRCLYVVPLNLKVSGSV